MFGKEKKGGMEKRAQLQLNPRSQNDLRMASETVKLAEASTISQITKRTVEVH